MLTSISIKNYALINELHIDFSSGLSIITGETGAGKSILLGALGLVLGNRADSSTLKDTTRKCIVEAVISIDKYKLQDFFDAQDIDYESHTIIRREILPSGKSRAFINDTPVVLSVLNALRLKLIDIHSQHQTLQLSDQQFQFQLLDAIANNELKLASYQRGLEHYNQAKKTLEEIQKAQREANQQYDYNLHLYQELLDANLIEDEELELEEKLDAVGVGFLKQQKDIKKLKKRQSRKMTAMKFVGVVFDPEKYKSGEAEINEALSNGFEVLRDFETGGGIVIALGKWENKSKTVNKEWNN